MNLMKLFCQCFFKTDETILFLLLITTYSEILLLHPIYKKDLASRSTKAICDYQLYLLHNNTQSLYYYLSYYTQSCRLFISTYFKHYPTFLFLFRSQPTFWECTNNIFIIFIDIENTPYISTKKMFVQISSICFKFNIRDKSSMTHFQPFCFKFSNRDKKFIMHFPLAYPSVGKILVTSLNTNKLTPCQPVCFCDQ